MSLSSRAADGGGGGDGGNHYVEDGAVRRLATFSHYSAVEWLLRRLDDYIALVLITVPADRLNTQAEKEHIIYCCQQATKNHALSRRVVVRVFELRFISA